MRIVIVSNGMWCNSGYGVQCRHWIPRLQAQGHEVAQLAFYGLQGGKINMGGVTIYPCGYDAYANDVLPWVVHDFQADVFITLIDLWVMDPNLGRRASEAVGRWVPWIAWFPVDSSPPYPQIMERLAHVDYPCQYSKAGMAEVARAGGPPCRFLYHGVNTDVYRPRDPQEARALVNERIRITDGPPYFPPEAFICTMVAANKGYPPRKAFPEQLRAFAQFHQRHPEALLYLHSQLTPAMQGIDFGALLQSLGVPETAVRIVPQAWQHFGISEEDMALFFQSSDVLLGASTSEGFGIPLIEAQACGVPVISTNFSAMPELTVNGICTEPAQLQWSQMGTWQAMPSPTHIDAALETIYQWTPEHRAAESAKGVAFVQETFNWDAIVRDQWAPLLSEVERDIAERRTLEAAARNGAAVGAGV